MIRYDARINAIYVLPVDPFAMTPNQSYKVSFFHHAYHACHTPPLGLALRARSLAASYNGLRWYEQKENTWWQTTAAESLWIWFRLVMKALLQETEVSRDFSTIPPTSKSRSSELSVLACLPNDAYISYEKRQMHMKAELQAKTL